MRVSLTQFNDLCRADAGTIRAALRRAETAHDASAMAQAHNALCYLYGRGGDARRAARTAQGALEVLPVELIAERVMLTNTRLLFEMHAGRHQTVIELSPKAVVDAMLFGDDYRIAQAHSNFANSLKHSGEIDRAIERFTSARIHFELASHARHAAATDNNLAELYIQIGDTQQAHEYLDRAESYFRSSDDVSALGQLLDTRAQAFIKSGNLNAALTSITESLELIPENERQIRAESYNTKGRIHELKGEELEAQACYMAAIELLGAAGAVAMTNEHFLRVAARGESTPDRTGE